MAKWQFEATVLPSPRRYQRIERPAAEVERMSLDGTTRVDRLVAGSRYEHVLEYDPMDAADMATLITARDSSEAAGFIGTFEDDGGTTYEVRWPQLDRPLTSGGNVLGIVVRLIGSEAQ